MRFFLGGIMEKELSERTTPFSQGGCHLSILPEVLLESITRP
jgi:hypothetical protein